MSFGRFRPPKAAVVTAALLAAVALLSQPVTAAVNGSDSTDSRSTGDRKAAAGDRAALAYNLPLPQSALPRSEYDDPHHDYPAIDLPVPTGTQALAVTDGQAVVFTDSGCGNGVELTGSDGALYTYCHFDQHSIGSGPVGAGQQLGLTGSTGNSTGPHLHFQIKTSGTLRCPQPLLVAIYDGQAPPPPTSLPTTGCISFAARSGEPAEPLGLH
jgi:murein DD-endopeptidase MepM/ murein hydrolase activator NlpD